MNAEELKITQTCVPKKRPMMRWSFLFLNKIFLFSKYLLQTVVFKCHQKLNSKELNSSPSNWNIHIHHKNTAVIYVAKLSVYSIDASNKLKFILMTTWEYSLFRNCLQFKKMNDIVDRKMKTNWLMTCIYYIDCMNSIRKVMKNKEFWI